MDLSISTEIKEHPAGWSVTDTRKTPGGEAVDRGILEKDTLALRKRILTQGPVSLTLDISPGGKITGIAGTGGQSKALSLDAGSEMFADSPGGAHVVATLPRADGYRTSFRNVDILRMEVKVVQLVVSSAEHVRVPAGTFDAWKVDLASDDGGSETVWVDKTSRKVVKMAATLRQMNGAIFTAELLN